MQHFRAQETCEVRESPLASSQVDESKMRLLRQRGRTTATEDEKWYSMYRIIFPDDTSYPSPYYELEDKGIAFPSRAMAQGMFRENLNRILSKWNLDEEPATRGLHDPEIMNLIISGATAAFDETFTAMCNQNTNQPLDNEPSLIVGSAPEAEDDGEWHQPLVTDLNATGQTSTQVGEITELAVDGVSNPAFQYGPPGDLFTEIHGFGIDVPIELLSWDQAQQPQQQQKSYASPQPNHGELRTENYGCSLCGVSLDTQDHPALHIYAPALPGESSSAAPVSTPMQRQEHTGLDIGPFTGIQSSEVGHGGNILDRDLVTHRKGKVSLGMGGPPDAVAQSLGTALENNNHEQAQGITMWDDEFSNLLSQNDPDFSNWFHE
ncbi:unnamed protein product [Fusarium equiseti]|uniref:Uncharacterized protein n=1 Tax=Fusarium equiseti TaxID=61235 RepID=A0A8J2NIM7_FUSEQ|nr:unnamed protein product [Fusarium equiseti]